MSQIIPENLPECIEKPISNVINPITTNIGNTLGDLWFLALGGISQCAEKKRIKYAAELEKFKQSLETKVDSIPPERRIEPDTQIACQALDDSKYCVGSAEIREMFANLIASTMDSRFSNNIHPSFSSILKQMNSNDANFFKEFMPNSQLAICSFRLEDKSGGYISLLEKVYLKDANSTLVEANSNVLTLSVLERLGLVQVSLMESFTNEKLYEVYENSVIFRDYKHEYDNEKKRVTIKKGTAKLTALGRNLLEVCCPTVNIEIKIPTAPPDSNPNTEV